MGVANHGAVVVVDYPVTGHVAEDEVTRFQLVVSAMKLVLVLLGELADLFAVLEHAFRVVTVEETDGLAYLRTVDFAFELVPDGSGTVDDALGVGKLGHFVLVVGHVGGNAVAQPVVELVIPAQREFDTLVLHVSAVDVGSADAIYAQNRSTHQPVFRGLLVPVEGQSQTAVQEAGINTDVQLLGSLPSQFGVAQHVERTAGGGFFVVAHAEEVSVGFVESHLCQVLEVGDVAVTVLSPGCTDFEEVHDASDRFHELFIGHYPTCRCGGEDTPAVASGKV